MSEMSNTDKVIFDSRKSVFYTSLVYLILEIIIIIGGNLFALFIDDFIGALLVILVSCLITALGAMAMYLQTAPLKIEIDRLQKLGGTDEKEADLELDSLIAEAETVEDASSEQEQEGDESEETEESNIELEALIDFSDLNDEDKRIVAELEKKGEGSEDAEEGE